MQHENGAYVLQKGVLRLKLKAKPLAGETTQRIPGTAGVSPASSHKFTQVTVESLNSDQVAFNTSGRVEHPARLRSQ